MRKIILTTVLFVFFLCQVVLSDRIAIGRIAPDFPLLIVTYFAVFSGAFRGSIVGFIVGLFQDLFNPSLLGLNALAKSLTGYAFGVAGSKTEPESAPFLFALIGAAALAHDFLYLLFFTSLDIGRLFSMWITISIPSALYTAVLGVVIHKLIAFSLTEVVRSLGKARP